MSKMSDYLEAALHNHVLRGADGGASLTQPAAVYVALFTADPTDAYTTANEVANSGSYARQQAHFAAPSSPGGTCTTNADITFPTATGDWGTITHVGITTSATHAGGNLLYHGALDQSKTINTGDQFKILSGNLTVTLA